MSNKLIGIIEDDSLNVNVQITGSGPRGAKGNDGYTPIKGVDYMTAEDIDEIKEGLELDIEIEAATIEEIQRLF